jgi:hypothetical protein
VFKAELDVLRGDWLTVVELNARPQPEGDLFGIRRKLEALRQSGLVKEPVAVVLDQGIVEGGNEVIRSGGAVMLLRVQPA